MLSGLLPTPVAIHTLTWHPSPLTGMGGPTRARGNCSPPPGLGLHSSYLRR